MHPSKLAEQAYPENTHLFEGFAVHHFLLCCFMAITDPVPSCQETDASQKCLDAYNYDKRMCSAYFQAYKDCRKYWVSSSFSHSSFV